VLTLSGSNCLCVPVIGVQLSMYPLFSADPSLLTESMSLKSLNFTFLSIWMSHSVGVLPLYWERVDSLEFHFGLYRMLYEFF